MKALINNSLIAKLEAKKAHYDVWDTKLAGFFVRVNTSGRSFYRCMYRKNGVRKFYTVGRTGLMSSVEAREKARILLGNAAQNVFPDQKSQPTNKVLTFKEYIESEYGHWKVLNRKSGKEDVKKLEKSFFEKFGDLSLSTISIMAVEKWRSIKLKTGIAVSTVNRNIACLKAALSKAEEWGLIKENPLARLKPLKNNKTPIIRYLSVDEEKRLRQALAARHKKLIDARKSANEWRKSRGYDELPEYYEDYLQPMALLSMNTGIRRGELFGIKWKDVNLKTAVLTIPAEINKSLTARYIPLNKEAKRILLEWQKICRGEINDYIFSNNGKAFTTVKRAWDSLKQMADLKNFRWHDFRHHFASRLVMAGVDLNTVRELLGHSDIKMTLRYAHLAPEHKARAVEKLLENNAFLD